MNGIVLVVELLCAELPLGWGNFRSGVSDLRQDLVRLWKAVRLVLGEDHLTVDDDIKNSSTAADQFRFDAGLALDGGCQTGSPG